MICGVTPSTGHDGAAYAIRLIEGVIYQALASTGRGFRGRREGPMKSLGRR
jgi:hypothetical protein